MTQIFVNQLKPQDTIDQIFLASDKQLRSNRNGNLYLQVDLSDRTGMIGGRMWNTTNEAFESFENGDYVHVEGSTQLFQGMIQLIVGKIRRVDPSEVDPDCFQRLSSAKIDQMTVRVAELLRGIKDVGLLNLAEVFLMDQPFMRRFAEAPAGIKNHHAYRGGLLEHTLNLMEVVLRITPRYPEINQDLLLIGAFLHDVGKTEELEYEQGYTYGDEGQLLGHLVIGVEMVDRKIVEAERLGGETIDPELVLRLKHMLLSHHGEYEFGSPKLPMTLEATALAFLDNLDSKIASFSQQINDCPNNESSWTAYNPNIQRKLFKGGRE